MTGARLLVAVSGAIPAVVAMWVIDRLDAKRPEPLHLRRLVVIFSAWCPSCPPCSSSSRSKALTPGGILDPLEMTYQGASFKAFVMAASVEEACKLCVVYWVVWRRPEFDERMDGIVYATRAGLGFALVENMMYLLLQPTLSGELLVWVMRACLSVPGHALWSAMAGASAARRRFDGKGLGLVGGYLLAVAFHGAYDAVVFVQTPLAYEGHTTLAQILKFGPLALTIAGVLVVPRWRRRRCASTTTMPLGLRLRPRCCNTRARGTRRRARAQQHEPPAAPDRVTHRSAGEAGPKNTPIANSQKPRSRCAPAKPGGR